MGDSTIQSEKTNPEDWLSEFGLSEFRAGQRKVIDAIFEGRDTLCIMPTGGGKSLCFQLPTIAREGVTLVVSPLIALMKDQVDSLIENGLPATFINSSLSLDEQQSRIGGMLAGEFKLVYIAPERLRSNSFMRAVQKTRIQLLAIDEAHCISQWGHDFRPDYARLGRLRSLIGNPQTIALTATATELVQEDICKILELKNPARFVTGFARSNLSLHVWSPKSNSEKEKDLVRFLNAHPGCGIIYASTRKNCEQLIELLESEIKRSVAFYHAGLAPDVRRDVQEKFMHGEIEIIVATNAFGMGIDKADLRFVVHFNLPGSIEAYYQEAGRAGRDGKPSECVLLYSFQDKFIQEFFIENSYPSRETIKQVYEYLRGVESDPIEVTLQEIKEDLGLSIGTNGIGNCENLLEKAGAIERLDSRQNMAAIRIDSDLPTLIDFLPRDARSQRHVLKGLEQVVGDFRHERILFQPKRFADRLDMKWEAVNRAIRQLVKLPMIDYIPPFRGRAIHVVDKSKRFAELDIDFDELRRRQQSEVAKLESVIKFATSRRCRQLEILEYFGDPDRKKCDNCDNCGEKSARAELVEPIRRSGDSDACLYAAQVALSGTARTKGRVGKTMIAQMLTGSTSKKVSRYSQLSTFGLLENLRQTDVVLLLEFLIEQGYIHQSEKVKFRPTASVSASGTSLMRGEQYVDLAMRLPSSLANEISYRLRGKKPYLVEGLARGESKRETEIDEPALEQETTEDSGPEPRVPTQLDTKEDGIFDEPSVVADESPDETLDGDDQQLIRFDTPDGDSPPPSHYWTWRLLADGYQADEICQIRGVTADEVFDHAIRAGEEGKTLDAKWLLNIETIEQLQTFVAQNPDRRLSRLLQDVPSGVKPRQVIYFLNCERQESAEDSD